MSQAPGHTPPPTVAPGSRTGSWGYPARIARGGGDGSDLTFAVIPAPTYPVPSRTLQRRTDAIAATYTGRWEEAVDLYRQTVGEDGFFDGILRTMSQGILGLPTSFQGDSEIVSALDDADGTPSDYARMHPLEECAKIFEDGCGLGVGIGQYLLMCWRCDYTDHDRVQSHETGRVWEVCRRCDAARIDRPAGLRELFQLQWRDPRWLWQNTISYRWYYTARDGLIPIVDGDGEWFMFRTVPGLEPWRHGAWIWATLAAIFSRDAQYDAQNTSSVCAPTPVLRALKPTGPEARREAERKMENLAFDNRFVLDGEWIYEIISASADYREICEAIVNRCSDAFETGLTGNVMGRSARSAFTDANVYNRTTRERRAFYAGAWHRQIREKGLVWYARDNFPGRVAPVSTADVRSPEDKLAASTALKAEGEALAAIKGGADAIGIELEPAWVIERLQRIGIRAKAKAAPPAPAAPPPVDTPSPPPQAPPAAPAPAPEDDEPDAREDGAVHGAAERAAAMNAAGLTACRHGRTNACPHCGVRGHWMPIEGGGWAVTWEPIEGARARLEALTLDAAEARLAAALAVLDALDAAGEDATRARFNPDQKRGPDGRFGSGGGATHTPEGHAIVHSAGTKDGLGASKAARAARKDSTAAQKASDAAKVGGDHEAAAKAHTDAAAQHREAAARSIRPDYRAAHEAAAKAHEDVAKAHRIEHDRPAREAAKAATDAARSARFGADTRTSEGAKRAAELQEAAAAAWKKVRHPADDEKYRAEDHEWNAKELRRQAQNIEYAENPRTKEERDARKKGLAAVEKTKALKYVYYSAYGAHEATALAHDEETHRHAAREHAEQASKMAELSDRKSKEPSYVKAEAREAKKAHEAAAAAHNKAADTIAKREAEAAHSAVFGRGHGSAVSGSLHTDPAVSAEHHAEVNRAIGAVPEGLQRAIAAKGVKVHSVVLTTDALPGIAGKQPRGWSEGSKWEQVGGVYSGSAKAAVVAHGTSDFSDNPGDAHSRRGVALHEYGHAVDMNSGHPSMEKWFVDAHIDATKSRGDDAMSRWVREDRGWGHGDYFRQPGHAGAEEFFAEAWNASFRSEASRRTFDKHFPGLREKIARHVAAHHGLIKKGG